MQRGRELNVGHWTLSVGRFPAADAPDYEAMLAIVYAWTGEIDQAMALLPPLLTTPSGSSFVELRLRWEFDPLRNDSRFKQILAAPEPKTMY